ncbi:MAG: VOC family protein [Bacteroidales bacterium]|nr:VOC family protein [Bacteroidales bacterium]
MTSANIYLTFNGNCEEAFLYYKSIFGGEFEQISRFKEMPEDPKFPISEEDKEKIMHVSLPISKEAVIMGSDIGGEWAAKFKEGNNFSISINTDSKKEADRLFSKLSGGGEIIMPITKTFWGSYFGNLIDKYGIQWMVSFNDVNPT